MFRHIDPLGRVWSGSLYSLYHRSSRWTTCHCMYLLAHHPQRYTPRTATFCLLIFSTYYYNILTANLIKKITRFLTVDSFGHTVAVILVFVTLKMAT